MAQEKLICQVCEKEEALGVACVPGIPVSAAYGKDCLQWNAHPYRYLRANVVCCGGVEHTDPQYLWGMMTFVDGKYLSLAEALAKHPITAEELADDLHHSSGPD